MMSSILREKLKALTVEVAFQYTNEFHENILGFCNNIYNAGGRNTYYRF